MRPVLLRMTSFAAFREPTVVDFRDADYFVLVGPTGAGKSTVIDAMTFALYGSVPRWDDRRTVALALAPTAGRGAVSLVFDVGGERYVVARELRRAPSSGNVTVREARLERLVDPSGTAEPGEDTVPVADGAARVSAAVEDLLGLPFDDFCTCVVLPQGAFADFLHAAPRERQETLKRILGLGVYDVIKQRANGEATAQEQRAAMAAERLGRYADATEEASAGAEHRVGELEKLRLRIGETVPRLAAVTAELDGAREAVESATRQRTALTGLRPPDGTDELDARRRRDDGTVETAAAAVADAERADSAARTERAAAPDRAVLEQVRARHGELARLDGEQPGLVRVRDEAVRAVADAATAVAGAETAEEAARTARDRTTAESDATAADLARLEADLEALAAPSPPEGLDDLGRRRDAAAAALDERSRSLDAAERAEDIARDAVAAGPDRAALEQAARDHRALDAARTARGAARTEVDTAAAARDRAAADLAGVRHELDHARAALAAAERADLAGSLRPSLVQGDDCPVCAQTVATLPPPLPGGGVAAARDALAAVEGRHTAAQAADHRADAAAAAARRDDERADAEVVRLEAALAGFGDAAAVGAALDDLDARDHALAEAGTALRAARRARDDASEQVAALRRETDAVAAGLRTARAPLTALGPVPGAVRADGPVSGAGRAGGAVPGAGRAGGPVSGASRGDGPPPETDDPVTGWHELVAWADRQHRLRAETLPAVRAAARQAAAGRDAAVAAAESARDATARARREQTGAVRSEQEAVSALGAAERRAAELRDALDGAPSDAEAADGLERIAVLDRRAADADAALRDARSAWTAARRAAEHTAAEVAAGWDELRRRRDPLVALDAPAPQGTDLTAAWSALVEWATAEAAVRDERIREAGTAADRAGSARDELVATLRDELGAHGVQPGADPVADAPAAVATAVAEAVGARDRIAERRAEAADLVAEHDTARERHHVAKLLGDELRSNRFPRWLVASALDALVADASVSLAELSGGQFALTHDDGEFLVVDHADADARRPVKTLSGGETFQASLALALALSDQLSGLAADGAARLESIFLDEGFGTLDEANLETVASTLENLATRGDRMVGVITHVRALAERIPTRFTLSRDNRTSTIEREP